VETAKVLELLWRQHTPSVHGPRPSLSVDQIVDAAIGVADADGVEALTMRRVAQALGKAPMSLYTYVPGKGELLDLMIDQVYARMPRSVPSGDGWRARVTAVAGDNLALYEQHPWVLATASVRPPMGPGLVAKYDYELRALDGLGLSDVSMDAALTFVLGFVEHAARAAAAVRATAAQSALNDAQWWQEVGPLLERVFDAQRYPVAARIGAAAGAAHDAYYHPAHAYEFGLARVLDGLGELVERGAENM
jgi:AcrR family transcriptional regulator